MVRITIFFKIFFQLGPCDKFAPCWGKKNPKNCTVITRLYCLRSDAETAASRLFVFASRAVGAGRRFHRASAARRCLKITHVPLKKDNVTKPAAQNLNSPAEYLRIESGFSLLYGVYWRKPNASPMFSPFSTTLLCICVRPELDHALSVRGSAEDGGDPGSHCLHTHYAVRSQMPAH